MQNLVKALEFYANPDTYLAIGFFPDPPCGAFVDDFDETKKPGALARATLKAFNTQQITEGKPITIFEKDYDGGTDLSDISVDVEQCLDPDFNETIRNIPQNFTGKISMKVSITYTEAQAKTK